MIITNGCNGLLIIFSFWKTFIYLFKSHDGSWFIPIGYMSYGWRATDKVSWIHTPKSGVTRPSILDHVEWFPLELPSKHWRQQRIKVHQARHWMFCLMNFNSLMTQSFLPFFIRPFSVLLKPLTKGKKPASPSLI